MNATSLLFDLATYHSSIYPVGFWMFIDLFGVDNEVGFGGGHIREVLKQK